MTPEGLPMRKTSDFFPLLNPNNSNGLFEPLDIWDKNAWQNKNRRIWTPEEIEELCPVESRDFVKNLTISDRYVLLLNFNRDIAENQIINPDKYAKTTAYIGKIIQMGKEVFTKKNFPQGAEATYNDWVIYNFLEGRPRKSKNNVFTIIKDKYISGPVKDPTEFNYY